MRTFERSDLEFIRGIRFEKEFEITDADGNHVPYSEVDYFVAVIKATDEVDGDSIASLMVEIIDDEELKVVVTASAETTATFTKATTAGYFFLYYYDLDGEIVPLKRGKLSVI